MGTHATTRIESENDYIESHTRWDGFPEEIKKDILMLNKKWTSCVTNMKIAMEEKQYKSPYLDKWIEDFNKLLIEVESTKNISKIMGLLCSQSLNHHHVLPTHEPMGGDLLDYWGQNNPSVVFKALNGKFNKSKKLKSVESKELPINDTNFVIRLIDVENKKESYNEKSEKYMYNDVYVEGMTLEEVQELIFQLPYFFFETHYIMRKSEKELNKEYEKNNYVSSMIFDGHQFKRFYNPEKKYLRRDYVYQDKELILDEVSSLIPFDFSASALSTHLFIASAGKIRSLTVAESNWSKTLENTERVYVQQTGGRRNLLAFKPKDSKKLYDSLKSRLSVISKVNSNLKVNSEVYALAENLNAIDYEKTVVNIFELLSITPTQEDLEKVKKQKKNMIIW